MAPADTGNVGICPPNEVRLAGAGLAKDGRDENSRIGRRGQELTDDVMLRNERGALPSLSPLPPDAQRRVCGQENLVRRSCRLGRNRRRNRLSTPTGEANRKSAHFGASI